MVQNRADTTSGERNGVSRPLAAAGLNTWELRKGIEMCVAGEQDKRMLQDEGCDPHIIRRDRSALPSQLPENRAAHENAKLWIEPM
jgi:hypothetical protein